MTTANDVIAALNQRRLLKAGRALDHARLASGWQRWFDAMPKIEPEATARPRALVDALAARPLRPVPPRSPSMGRLAALRSLLRQGAEPDDPGERGLRIGAGALDILVHIVLVGFLLWLMYLGMLALQQAPQEDEAVQVAFIGRGNAEEGGGALAAEGAQSAPSAAGSRQPAPSADMPSVPGVPTQAAPAPAPTIASSQPQPSAQAELSPVPELPVAQPLQVSEVPQPDPDAFQLPPPRPADLAAREIQLRSRQPVVRDVEVVVTQPLRRVEAPIPQPREVRLRMPEVTAREQAVEVVRPAPVQRSVAIPTPSRAPTTLAMPTVSGRVRDIPTRIGTPAPAAQPGEGSASAAQPAASGAGGQRGGAPAAGQAASGQAAGNRAAQYSGRGVAATGSGAGPATRPAPGGWPGAAKSDDWGAASRNTAGTGTGSGRDGGGGLYNRDGSLRLPDEWTRQAGVDIDREGTWLKRPGLEYRGTRFDRYWVPQGTLLEEWVRRGIKRIAIPIPGSSARLECVVSLLQLGGGCFPVNPDVNEQPATARPPPDIPFKPELQEDNGSVRPQDGG